MASVDDHVSRLTLKGLLSECKQRGVLVGQCLERADLETALKQSYASEARAKRTEPAEIDAAKEELESWVIYAPRAKALLRTIANSAHDVLRVRETKLDLIVSRYTKHTDAGVVELAEQLTEMWTSTCTAQGNAALSSPTPARCKPSTEPATADVPARGAPDSHTSKPPELGNKAPANGRRKRRTVASDDDSASIQPKRSPRRRRIEKESNDAEVVQSSDEDTQKSAKSKAGEHLPQRKGWYQAEPDKVTFRGKEQVYHVLRLDGPFKCSKWYCYLRISKECYDSKILELLNQMARDFGAVTREPGEECSAADEQLLRRLKRLEERFKGNGVTEGEARNAMRLFERELSKANWTEDKFAKLKRQLEGSEEWSMADTVVEGAVHWTSENKRRQAWFSDASERVGIPLGLLPGYAPRGGSAFVGPLSTVAGALLTTSLVCHFADLDLARAAKERGGSKISAPQFLQGFVDGALSEDRHLVWEKIFSIEDGEEAARYCQERLQSGFFDDDEARADVSEPAEDDGAVQDLLRGLFSAAGTGSSSRRRDSVPQSYGPADSPHVTPPASFTPFSGTGKRLDLDMDESASPKSGKAAPSNAAASNSSWAITFASNLQVARLSRERSKAEAKKTYHWTFSGRALKATPTGTESYSKGKQAGEKRKAEIDSTTGTAKQKYKKGSRLAIME